MSTKGFLLLLATVIVIGGSIGGAFSGGLALGRSQSDDDDPIAALLEQRLGGLSGGPLSEGSGAGGVFSGQAYPSGEGESEITPRGPRQAGVTTGISRDALNGTVSSLEGSLLTVSAGDRENQVDLGGNTVVQVFGLGTPEDISQGDRVLVIAAGDTSGGGPVDAISVTVNPPEGGAFGGGGFAGRGGFGGAGGTPIAILSGTVSETGDGRITVATDSGDTQVNLADDLEVQVYREGTPDDISSGDQVLVISTTDDESGDPITTTTVIVNPPEIGGFGGGLFGGRPQRRP
jgi:hypothetical protein